MTLEKIVYSCADFFIGSIEWMKYYNRKFLPGFVLTIALAVPYSTYFMRRADKDITSITKEKVAVLEKRKNNRCKTMPVVMIYEMPPIEIIAKKKTRYKKKHYRTRRARRKLDYEPTQVGDGNMPNIGQIAPPKMPVADKVKHQQAYMKKEPDSQIEHM